MEVCVIGEFRGNLADRIGRVSRALSNPSISVIFAQSFEEECKEEIPRMDLSNLGDISNGTITVSVSGILKNSWPKRANNEIPVLEV